MEKHPQVFSLPKSDSRLHEKTTSLPTQSVFFSNQTYSLPEVFLLPNAEKFFQTERVNQRSFEIIPQKIYRPQVDLRLSSGGLTSIEKDIQSKRTLPSLKNDVLAIVPKPIENQQIHYENFMDTPLLFSRGDIHQSFNKETNFIINTKQPKLRDYTPEFDNKASGNPTLIHPTKPRYPSQRIQYLPPKMVESTNTLKPHFEKRQTELDGAIDQSTYFNGNQIKSLSRKIDRSSLQLETSVEVTNNRDSQIQLNPLVEQSKQSGAIDSYNPLPPGNRYLERTTNSTTYPTDVQKHYINIDTRFRNNPTLTTSTNFRWRLFRPIRNAISIRVASIEIPNNFYTFSAAKKNIEFSARLSSSPSYTPFTIPEGNYTVTDMVTALQDKLDTIDTNFTVSISLVTGKCSITNAVFNFDIQFPKDENSYEFGWGLGYYLGFNNSSYTNTQNLVSERLIDLMGDNYIFLQIGDYQGVFHEVEKQGLITATAKIILNSDKYQILFDNGSNFISKEVLFPMPTDLSAFNVRLIDSNNNDIDMMGSNYSFTIEIVEIVNSRLYSSYSDNLLQNSDTPR